ncbi:MAG TPA: serine hydrolase domain-containing protein, partial [Kofleriaceae bacterium]|nr:serine hydrolase domain-containing protein [Kofleriaceae bacterium]
MQIRWKSWMVMCSLLGGCAVDETVVGVTTEAVEVTPTPSVPPFERTVKSIVDEEVGPAIDPVTGERRYVGLSVVVIRNGSRYQFHYGEAVLGSGVKPNSRTFYSIASVTKTFVATQLALYARRNLLELDDTLDAHTSYALGGDRDQITLQELAMHHAGLPREIPGGNSPYRTGTYSGDFATLMGTLDDCAEGCGPPAPLTGQSSYSNYGYAVLGYVLSRKLSTSDTVQAGLNKSLLDPLGITETRSKDYITDSSCLAANTTCTYSDYGECTYVPACNMTFSARAAIGYYANGSTIQRAADEGWDQYVGAGAGTLWSTPNDMSKWLAYHMDSSSEVSSELRAILPATHRVR